MGMKQHLVTLAGIGNQPKCTAGTELHVRDLNLPEQPPNQQTSFTPVERHKGSQGFSLLAAPRADEGCQLAVAAVVALSFDLFEESLGGSAVARLDIQTNFAEMLVGFLILERFDNLAQREMTINNRTHTISINSSDHVLLLAAAAHQYTLQTHLLDQCWYKIHCTAYATQYPDDGDMTSNPSCNHRLLEGRRASDFYDVINTTAAR